MPRRPSGTDGAKTTSSMTMKWRPVRAFLQDEVSSSYLWHGQRGSGLRAGLGSGWQQQAIPHDSESKEVFELVANECTCKLSNVGRDEARLSKSHQAGACIGSPRVWPLSMPNQPDLWPSPTQRAMKDALYRSPTATSYCHSCSVARATSSYCHVHTEARADLSELEMVLRPMLPSLPP